MRDGACCVLNGPASDHQYCGAEPPAIMRAAEPACCKCSGSLAHCYLPGRFGPTLLDWAYLGYLLERIMVVVVKREQRP